MSAEVVVEKKCDRCGRVLASQRQVGEEPWEHDEVQAMITKGEPKFAVTGEHGMVIVEFTDLCDKCESRLDAIVGMIRRSTKDKKPKAKKSE